MKKMNSITTKQIYNILSTSIPQKDTWSKGEQYGAYNCDDIWDKPVKKILFCVTPTEEVVDYAKEHKYDLIIAHHPFVMQFPMFIFHTALDCCQGGLNDMWRDFLGMTNCKHFDENLGWYGDIKPISFKSLCQKVKSFSTQIVGQTYLDADASDDIIRSVCVCSGLGGLVMGTASKTKADCYICGELSSDMTQDSWGFKAVIETGHTFSEHMGINLIRKLLHNTYIKIDQAPLDLDKFGWETHWGYPEEKWSEAEKKEMRKQRAQAEKPQEEVYHMVDNVPVPCMGEYCELCEIKAQYSMVEEEGEF